jgi:hypothetical protein
MIKFPLEYHKFLRFPHAMEHMNPYRERIGFVVGDGHSLNAALAVSKIVAAEGA